MPTVFVCLFNEAAALGMLPNDSVRLVEAGRPHMSKNGLYETIYIYTTTFAPGFEVFCFGAG